MALAVFATAIAHTFCTGYFEGLARRSQHHAGLWHLLGEVEVVFGLWAAVLFVVMAAAMDVVSAVQYVDGRNYTEPLFVFAIMTVAATRPILDLVQRCVAGLSRVLPLAGAIGRWLVILALIPLLGSLITEPAAMTVAALALSRDLANPSLSNRLKYATLGVLFVNISIGGTLTNFAAPPVLMVASTWQWDSAFMLATFGWKAAVAVLVNATACTFVLRRHLPHASALEAGRQAQPPVPAAVACVHILLLAGVVLFAHHPVVFLGLFLMFLGFAQAYERHQSPLILKEALLVGFFLAGLVVLGGMQQWWLQPIVSGLEPLALFAGALGLTAITDNAALTYLGSLIEGISDPAKYMLVAGAVAGGGLTVIANAPNPAGVALLKRGFADETIGAGGLLLGALGPTAVAATAFLLL